jgi:hypothetical protein
MDTHPAATTPRFEVDLDSTSRRLLLAREQCASQSSTERLRSFGAMRAWLTARQRGAARPER